METRVVSLEEIKHVLDTDMSLKFRGRFFFNDNIAYTCDYMNEARDYYFNIPSRIVRIDDQNLIKQLIWEKHARHDLMDGKIAYENLIYDGGEFAKQESIKYEREYMKKRWNAYMKDIAATHNRLTEERVREIANDQSVFITKEAKEKAHRIAERMVRLTGDNEIRMDGINFMGLEADPVIRDVYISDGQEDSPAECWQDLKSRASMTQRLQAENKYRVAWMHSHANMNPYHSSEDNRNLRDLTFSFGKEVEIRIDADNFISKTKVKIYPSLVFNAKRTEPYVEIGMRYYLPGKARDERRLPYRYSSLKNAHLTVINERNGIDLSTESIDRQILERVTWPGKNIRNLEEILAKYETAPAEAESKDSRRKGYEWISRGIYAAASYLLRIEKENRARQKRKISEK